MQLKADSYIQLSKSIEDTIMPLLHQQIGFCSGVTQISPERSEATEDTFWNTENDVRAYQKTGYPKILETLSGVVLKTPVVVISEVSE